MKQKSVHDNILPGSARLPVNIFSQLLDNVTTSYKYLFLLSLLRITGRRYAENNGSPVYSFREISAEMLTVGWYPHVLFRLSFGTLDSIARIIDSSGPIIIGTGRTMPREEVIRKHFMGIDSGLELMRFVPYRLLRPFFEKELKGIKDAVVNSEIKKLSAGLYNARKPLYIITDNDDGIIINHDWKLYFINHYPIIESWILWKWLSYMQSRNPNTPNIAAKLIPSLPRRPLSQQRNLWKKGVASESRYTCPYSGNLIDTESFALDHVLPWTLVAHDQLWNLVPCVPDVNSSKSDFLPDRSYIPEIAERQSMLLSCLKGAVRGAEWNKIAAEYCMALRIEEESALLDKKYLVNEYKKIYFPLMELALSQGFKNSWRYKTA